MEPSYVGKDIKIFEYPQPIMEIVSEDGKHVVTVRTLEDAKAVLASANRFIQSIEGIQGDVDTEAKISHFDHPTDDLEVGHAVVTKDGSHLRSGRQEYGGAVVASLEPFVLVSLDADMRWESTVTKQDFRAIGKVSDRVLKKCKERL